MTAPRLEIDLSRIHHNVRTLVGRLDPLGISVTGVTKATLGSPEVAREMVLAGVTSIGESRIENIEAMRLADLRTTMTLIRSPMPSQVERVVASADISLNTEFDVIDALSAAAGRQHRRHGIVLMVELGDLREGILAEDLSSMVGRTLDLDHLDLCGIGANLACQSGIAPDATNMAVLSSLADSLEARFAITLPLISGGNSANLRWALSGADVGRVDDLRLGESILLGRDPLDREPIDGLHTDAITLVAEVIESNRKPVRPWGEVHQNAFGMTARPDMTARPELPGEGDATRAQVIVALGRQDVDPDGLVVPDGLHVLGASSDHLVLAAHRDGTPVGTELRFGLDYSAMVRAMTSPFVTREFLRATPDAGPSRPAPDLRPGGSRACAPPG